MSSPDYDQFSEDHQCLLIVVKPIGPQMNQNLFDLIYEKLEQLNELKITNNKILGFERTIRLRYRQSYSIEDNDWGDFQAHRKLIGLITIARSFNQNELESISELHKTIHDTYNNTLFNSKCFIITSSNPSNTILENEKNMIDDRNNTKNYDSVEELKESKHAPNETDPILDFDIGGQLYISSDHTSFKSRVNRSSSSSSLSSQNSQSTVAASGPNSIIKPGKSIEESLNYSLPSMTDDEINLNHTRSRTHSRNKSLDSRLLSINETETDFSSNQLNIPQSKRTHSSSTSLSTTNCDSSNLYSSANEYIHYESDEQCCEQIKSKAQEFINGLFWALESKRLDKTREKKDKIPLLMAPCEKKDLVGLDTDTRSFKKKCLGRMQKHIADLSLLVGLPQESFLNYLTSIEYLKDVKDKLWLASAYEGLCAASLVLLFPKRWHHIQNLRQKFSFSKGLVQDLLSRKDYSTARTEVGQFMKKIALEDSQIDQQVSNNKTLMKSILSIDQFYEKYKEAATYYALYRGAAVLEFECSFKAAKTLTFFRKYLKASDFIQNAVFISLNQPIDEQIERLLRISYLYETIGFFRKAAFFKRFAALKTVSQAKCLDWEKCYFLMLPALYGYGLILDPTEYDKLLESGQTNWSSIHVQLLQEIITTSLKMQNETLAIRHLSFMLQCLFSHITPSQRQEFATKLSSLASKCGEGSPVPLRLSNGATIPSVNFTKFPTVVYFKIEPLKPYLNLYKLRSKSIKDAEEAENQKFSGPFIYTPLQLNRSPQRNNPKNPDSVKKMNFFWSEGNIGCISMSLHNFLPIELNISSIVVMTDGVAFEPKHDTALKISPQSTYRNILLTGIPRSSGTLDILGYKIHTLGIKSDCRLKQLPNAKKLKLPSKFTVEVVPRLPLLCAECLADDLDEEISSIKGIPSYKDLFPNCYVANSNFISLYEGQRKVHKIKLTNISSNNDELINLVNIQVIFPKRLNADLQNLIDFEWDINSINNLLPFELNSSIEFEMTFAAKGNFILSKSENPNEKNKIFHNLTQNEIPTKKFQVLGSKKLANFINELQSRKSSSEFSSLNSDQTRPDQNDESDSSEEMSKPKIVQMCLQFEYSGGPGLSSGFCRHTNIYFAIEIKSSILLTHWDVIQAEQMDECYLVLDTLNATEQEINLIYSSNKEMLIEPKEKCRIPVPIKRCPLSVSAGMDHSEIDNQSSENLNDLKRSIKSSNSVDFLTDIFPTERKLEAILSECRLHLLKQIDLKWIMPSADVKGIVLVDKVPYSRELLKSLLIPPIESEILLNSNLFRSSFGEMSLKLGQQLSIDIKLLNKSNAKLNLLRLYLIYYQDYQNPSLTRSHNYNNQNKIVVNGCESLCINELQTKGTYSHKCGLIFLYTGVYKLEVCCLPEERFQQLILETGSLIDVHFNTQHSLFKCLHSFEITVDE